MKRKGGGGSGINECTETPRATFQSVAAPLFDATSCSTLYTPAANTQNKMMRIYCLKCEARRHRYTTQFISKTLH